jgi:hypothetical protein
MAPNYTLKQKLITCILLLSLFLQSCCNFSNPVVPRATQKVHKRGLSNQTTIKNSSVVLKQLIGKEFTASGGHLGCVIN